MDIVQGMQSRSLKPDVASRFFHDVCCHSKTKNQTTSMFLEEEKAKRVLEEYSLSGIDLSQIKTNNDVYTPSLLSLLHVSCLPKEERKFALVIVDVQNDFISGSLAVADGAAVVPVINKIRDNFATVYKTADWHPADHISFHSNVKSGRHRCTDRDHAETNLFETVTVEGPPVLKQTLWPDHCVQNSKGAEFHADLMSRDTDIVIRKGMNTCVDSYSAFWDNGDTDHTPLYRSLLERSITDVVVCGIATDYCVGFTALDAARHGFKTYIVEDAVRGVSPDTVAPMVARCREAGISFIQSDSIPRDLLSLPFSRQELVDTICSSHSHFSKIELEKK